jgi:beta-lactamase superfamily II metal-dependent hydrolase
MLKINFLEAGQGDSIVIEWKDDDGIYKIGIVDCNLKTGNYNPTINFLKSNNSRRIEFMILTHPHTDHFSGFLSLLNYCEKEKINIDKFYHTGHYNKDYIKSICDKKIQLSLSSVYGDEDTYGSPKYKLSSLYLKLEQLHKAKNSILNKASLISDETIHIVLNQKYKIKFLAPAHYDEINEYLRKAAVPIENNCYMLENNPDANLLCTVLKISSPDSYILLTSDANKKVLKRLEDSVFSNLEKRIKLTDVPHHGSNSNHYEEFWLQRKNGTDIPAIFSVGDGYNHPSENVVKFFHEHYKVFSTNLVGGFAKFFAKENDLIHNLALLNVIDDSPSNLSADSRVGNLLIEWNEVEGCIVR